MSQFKESWVRVSVVHDGVEAAILAIRDIVLDLTDGRELNHLALLISGRLAAPILTLSIDLRG